MRWFGGFLLLCALCAGAEERVSVCFNYGCLMQAEVVFSDEQLRELGLLLGQAQDAAQKFDRDIKQSAGIIRGPLTVAQAIERYMEDYRSRAKPAGIAIFA